MSFCTAVNCIDGRVQVPVIEYMKDRFGTAYVDVVTKPGPVRVLSEGGDPELQASIRRRVAISVESHGSVGIAVVAHADCSGNPLGRDEQFDQLSASVDRLSQWFPGVPILGLWLGEDWAVEEILSAGGPHTEDTAAGQAA
ncbi:MAG: carbonic anhydrase [Candidatus Eisenbacteria bacterium]